MNLSAPFIRRPIGTTLLLAALVLAGAVAYTQLPVSPLPQVDFPTLSIAAQLPGASAEIMAATVATPLERQLGRIAGLTEMTSTSALGTTAITMQFDLSRSIDGAARDVQAAIQAARALLPANLPSDPTYRKVNPADAPIMILTLTSDTYSTAQLYDFASTIMAQRISQVDGVGQVTVGGAASPAVRVEVDPTALAGAGLAMTDVRAAIQGGLSNLARGQIERGPTVADILTNGQLLRPEDYGALVLAFDGGRILRIRDVARVVDGPQNLRTAGYSDGKPSVALVIFRAPGANIIRTVDNVRAALPQLRASIPEAVDATIIFDRTATIRASVSDVQHTLVLSVVLVVLVVFVFLVDVRATFIPAVAVPASLIGTFAVMYLFGFSIDNLSLMAITVAAGFVIDDAIVVMENITRHLEEGKRPVEAALLGASEIGFTVLSISLSLLVVFTPVIAMGGIVGRLLREFGVTLSIAIAISMVLSLTVTPMMCAIVLRYRRDARLRWYQRASLRGFDRLLAGYRRTLAWSLRHRVFTLLVFLAALALNVVLVVRVPKGFFPVQDTGMIFGAIRGPQDASFEAMNEATKEIVDAIRRDPAIDHVAAFTGTAGSTNTGNIFISLVPKGQRDASALGVIGRLRGPLAQVRGASTYLQPAQDVRVGGRPGGGQYQYTLRADRVEELSQWGPRFLAGVQQLPGFVDVSSDQQNGGLRAFLTYDRTTAARLGLTVQAIDSTLDSAFGQSLAAVMYRQRNQYYVVLEAAPSLTRSPADLANIYFRTPAPAAGANGPTPLASFATSDLGTVPLQINHTGLFPSVTVSFNLAPGLAVGDATRRVDELHGELGMPATIRGAFSGTLEAFKESLANEPILVLTALLAVYLVLGILYESLIHPLTILSTLPSASVGAMLALLLFGAEFDIVALVGIVLLIGIVKKNAIMMIDFALVAEREHGATPQDAIFEACLLRFRPIMMTTLAALFGAVPLAFGTGLGSEMRRPLGITIIGGLAVSQLLTLYTTPVLYLYLDRLRRRRTP
ncbi:MAG: efflux RND transporter permease subunit [Deltaproteobacteria bacterium]|nr:efflux RND transporter permease subunit [Deltaproteobacteria bacterium]